MDEADMKRHIADPLKREYREVLAALRDTLMVIPESEWTCGASKGAEPIRQAGHLLLAVEKTLGGHKARVGQRFGVPVESFRAVFDPAGCPSPADFLPWIEEVEQIAKDYIERAATLSITGAPKQHAPLHKPTYVLRHTIVHYITMRLELERRGLALPDY
jgi:hypothetical protein